MPLWHGIFTGEKTRETVKRLMALPESFLFPLSPEESEFELLINSRCSSIIRSSHFQKQGSYPAGITVSATSTPHQYSSSVPGLR